MGDQSQIKTAAAYLGQRRKSLLIDGRAVASESSEYLPVHNPATGEIIAEIPDATPGDVDTAVQAARRAFENPAWSGMRPADRERLLLRFADLIEAHAEELATIETLNSGKLIGLARAVEVGGSVEFTRYMAGWATKIEGSTLGVSMPPRPGGGYFAYTQKEPVGVVGAITPWNFPLSIAVWKTMSALACGCTVVLKPSEETPLTALRLGALGLEAGLPPGVLNVVTGRGPTAGAALASHPGIDKISFTGSTATGKIIGKAAVGNMARISLELGGKSPVIVLDDCDPEVAAQGAVNAVFFNQGQVCTAGSRLYVQRKMFDQIVDRVVVKARALKIGHGIDPTTQIGPMVSSRHRGRVMSYLESGVAEGARVATGGKAPDGPGYFVEPTVLLNTRQGMRVVDEEIFGPVLCAMPFDDIDEAIRLANDTPYGLSASIWSRDIAKVHRLIPLLKAGIVWVNTHNMLDNNLPFGGFKQSGVGRELGRTAIEQFTETKSVCIAY